MDVQRIAPLRGLLGCTTRAESGSGRIGPISLGAKQAGERSAGNPHAAFDAAEAGNVARSRWCDTRRRKSEPTGNTKFDLNRRASPRPYLRGAEGETPSVYSPVHPDRPGLPRSGRGHRLGEPGRSLLAALQHDGRLVLPRCAGRTAREEALARYGKPEIFNTDQGSQFTAAAFTGALIEAGVRISMDGRGRWMDNVFIERVWRSLKYEDIYLKGYADGREAKVGIGEYFAFYNEHRLHQGLGYRAPMAVWRDGAVQTCGPVDNAGRVGTKDCSFAPLTEPDMRASHPALWIDISELQHELG